MRVASTCKNSLDIGGAETSSTDSALCRTLPLEATSVKRAGVLVAEAHRATELDTPQGGLLPLLANIPLDDLDKELERRGHWFVRYADDLSILVKSHRTGERVIACVTRYLTGKLKLVVNAHKGRDVKTDECTCLGFTVEGKKLRWSEQAYEDFRHNLR